MQHDINIDFLQLRYSGKLLCDIPLSYAISNKIYLIKIDRNMYMVMDRMLYI